MQDITKNSFKKALVETLPILGGFTFLGISYGTLMTAKGFPSIYAVITAALVYAGSLEFILITLLTQPFAPLYTLFLTLVINGRHFFYAISTLSLFKDLGKVKPYVISFQSDESFSINYSTSIPDNVDRKKFIFFVALLCHFYWVFGTAIGAYFGMYLHIPSEGLNFVMTALFLVIFTSGYQKEKIHISSYLGLLMAFICLKLFGTRYFLMPALIFIVIVLTIIRPYLSKRIK